MREITGPACADLDDDTMFPEYPHAGNKSEETEQQYQLDVDFAKSFCLLCPADVRRECLVGALSRSEPYGVWGGLTTDERNALVAKLPELLYTAAVAA